MTTLQTTAPAAWAAILGFVQTAAALQSPPVTVFPAELSQYEPGSYIIVGDITNHGFDPESTGYEFIETYTIGGLCTVFTGSTNVDITTTAADIMADTYALYTACVMTPMVTNRGGNGVPVLGITNPQPVYWIMPNQIEFTQGPGNIGGGQGGWQAVIRWSYTLKALLSPA